jgi:hypothetical protein
MGFQPSGELLRAKIGILWGGGSMPAPGEPNYLWIADEIKAMQQGPLDVTVIDTWQVRLPTTLIWLENPAGLPKINIRPLTPHLRSQVVS